MPLPAADPARKSLTRGEWKLLALLAAVNCTQITDALLVAPLAVPLQEHLTIDTFRFSVLLAVYGFAAAVAGLFASAVIDRFDRKTVLLVAFAGLVGSILLTGLAPSYPLMLAARVLAGICGGLTTCATLAVVGEAVPERRRGSALGVLNAAFGGAAVVGLPACLAIKDAVGGLWAAFAAVAAFGLGVWLWAMFRLPRMSEHKATVRRDPVREFAAVVSRPSHALALAFMLATSLGTYTVIPFMAQYLQKNCGVSEDHFKYIFLAMGLCSLVGLLAVGKLTDLIGRRPVLLLMVGASIAVTLWFTNLPQVSVWTAAVVGCAYMVAAVGRLVPAHAIIQDSADPRTRGAFTTVYNSVSHLATSVGPLLAGLIVVEESPGGPIDRYWMAGLLAVAFAAIGLALSFFLKPLRLIPPKPIPEPATV